MPEAHAVEPRQVRRAFGRRHDVIGRYGQVDVGQVDLYGRRTERLQHGDRFLDLDAALGIEPRVEVLPHDADLQSLDRIAELRNVIRYRLVDRGRVALVEAGHDRQQARRVLGRARDRPGLVEARGERDHAVTRYATVGRLEPDRIGHGRGLANRTAGVRGRRRRRKSCRHRRRRPAGRAARRPLEVPGISDRAVIAGLVGRPHRELVHVGFAEHHDAGIGQAFHDRRVVRRYEVVEHLRAATRAHATGAEDVLVNDGQPVERPAPTGGAFGVGTGCRRERLLTRHRDQGIELVVFGRDTIEQRLGHFDRRKITGLEAGGEFAQAQRVDAHHSITLGTRYSPSLTAGAFSWKRSLWSDSVTTSGRRRCAASSGCAIGTTPSVSAWDS